MSEWIVFVLSMFCCQCWHYMAPQFYTEDKSIEGYTISRHSALLEAGDPVRRMNFHSDTEVLTAHQAASSMYEGLHANNSGMMTGPSLYIEQACGEPQGQQLILDFSPSAEIELRNQLYDLESRNGSGFSEDSVYETSESEIGLDQAQGDHGDNSQFRTEYSTSETEESINQYLDYESSSEIMSHYYEMLNPDERPDISTFELVDSHDVLTTNNKPEESLVSEVPEQLCVVPSCPELVQRKSDGNTACSTHVHSTTSLLSTNTLPSKPSQIQQQNNENCTTETTNIVDDKNTSTCPLLMYKSKLNSCEMEGSEIEIKNYIFEQNSLDMAELRDAQNPVIRDLSPLRRSPRPTKGEENNFPAVHSGRKSQDKDIKKISEEN